MKQYLLVLDEDCLERFSNVLNGIKFLEVYGVLTAPDSTAQFLVTPIPSQPVTEEKNVESTK